MSDFIFPVDASSPYHTTEHYLRRVLTGNLDSVRLRLIGALERLGYDILDEEQSVIRGRRSARGWGVSYSSADVLDYPMTLIVKLKQQGEHATRATFDYVVKHPSLSKGEKEILTREAEAISALATVRAVERICPACGTESTDDSRFCRRCGARMNIETKELELLKMSAEIRAGQASVVGAFVAAVAGTGLTAAAVVAILVSGIVLTKGISAILYIGVILSFLSVVSISFAWNRVRRSLQRPPETANPVFDHPKAQSNQPEMLAPVSPGSVTERTTNLLRAEPDPARTGEFLSASDEPVN